MEAKKIIITGGATRIGAAIAKSLVSYDVKMAIHFNKSKSSALKLKRELDKLFINLCPNTHKIYYPLIQIYFLRTIISFGNISNRLLNRHI